MIYNMWVDEKLQIKCIVKSKFPPAPELEPGAWTSTCLVISSLKFTSKTLLTYKRNSNCCSKC